MPDDVIAHMRERVKRARNVIELAHDPEMIALLSQMIVEAEADIQRLEDEQRASALTIDLPPAQDAQE
jgi:hypothetical protein